MNHKIDFLEFYCVLLFRFHLFQCKSDVWLFRFDAFFVNFAAPSSIVLITIETNHKMLKGKKNSMTEFRFPSQFFRTVFRFTCTGLELIQPLIVIIYNMLMCFLDEIKKEARRRRALIVFASLVNMHEFRGSGSNLMTFGRFRLTKTIIEKSKIKRNSHTNTVFDERLTTIRTQNAV